MFGQKHNSRQHQLYPPRPGYLSVLINNWSLRDRHRKLGILVDKLIKQEEVAEQRKPKFGYGENFRERKLQTDHSVVSNLIIN